MQRRRLLVALGAGLGGCLGSTRPRTATETTSVGGLDRRVSIVDQDAVPEAHRLRIEAEMLAATITLDHTARLRLTTTNTGQRRALSVGAGRCGLLNRNRGVSDDPTGLVLYRPGKAEHFDRRPGRWERDLPQDRAHGYNGYACQPVTYESGESLSNEYLLFDDYRTAEYLQPDTYHWVVPVEIYDDPNADPGAPPDTRFSWGFTLAVEELD